MSEFQYSVCVCRPFCSTDFSSSQQNLQLYAGVRSALGCHRRRFFLNPAMLFTCDPRILTCFRRRRHMEGPCAL